MTTPPRPERPTPPSVTPRRRRWRTLAIAFVGFVTGWGAFIALFGPGWFKRRVERQITQYIHRPASLGPISVSPYSLTFRVDSVRIDDGDGGPLFQWDRLAVTYELLTFFRTGDVRFSAIELVRHYARLRLSKEGVLNVQDVIDSIAATPSRPLPPIAIGRLKIDQLRLEWYDSARTRPFFTRLGPASIDLRNFTTRQDSLSRYTLAGRTEADETFAWKGTLGVAPFASSGEITLGNLQLAKYAPYYGDALRAQVTGGTLSLDAKYAVRADPKKRESRLVGATLDVRDLVLALGGTSPARLGRLHIGGLEADAVARTATLGELTLGGLALDVVRSPRGELNLAGILASAAAPSSARATAPSTARATAPSTAATARARDAAWRWTVHHLAIDSARVSLVDSVPALVGKLKATHVAARLDTLSSDPDVASTAHAEFTLEGGGRLVADARGPLARRRGVATLLLDSLPMFQADPWIAAAGGRLALVSGRLHLNLKVDFDATDAARPAATLSGGLRVDNLGTRERDDGDPFISWRSFRFDGIQYDTRAATLDIAQVTLDRPVVPIGIDSLGTSHLTHLFPPPARGVTDSASAPVDRSRAAARTDNAATAPPGAASVLKRITVGKVAITNGAIRVTDESVNPVMRFTIGRLAGTTGKFDSDNVSRGELALSAMLDEIAPLSIKGQLNPLSDANESILTIEATGIDLLPFSGYSGRYLGYQIAKGKMKSRLDWHLKQRKVKSDNVLTLDGFTFGEKTNHPDATGMPVKLGFAVLRDRAGQIVLDVPIEGSLDDPDFGLGRVIVRALLNILRNVATAPFKLLGSLFGGGDADLSEAPFDAGTSTLLVDSKTRLDALRKSLVERPDLKLEIEGAVDTLADRDALRKLALEKRLRQQAPMLADSVLLLPSGRAVRLANEFAALFPADSAVSAARVTRRPLVEALAGRDLESRVLPAVVVGVAELRALADARARACRDYLLSTEGASVERVFLAATGAAPAAVGRKATFKLQ